MIKHSKEEILKLRKEGKSWGKEKLLKEIDKCILVCSNNHIEIHTNLNKNNKIGTFV